MDESTESWVSDLSDENIVKTKDGTMYNKYQIRGQLLDENGKGIHKRAGSSGKPNSGSISLRKRKGSSRNESHSKNGSRSDDPVNNDTALSINNGDTTDRNLIGRQLMSKRANKSHEQQNTRYHKPIGEESNNTLSEITFKLSGTTDGDKNMLKQAALEMQ